MATVASLSRHVSFVTALPELGVDVRTSVLPARVTCPLCKHEQLHVCRDHVRDGEWCYCHNCHFAGDLIQLAAAVHGESIESTIRSIVARMQLPEAILTAASINGYIDEYVNKDIGTKKFWQECQQYHIRQSTFELRNLQAKIGADRTGGDWLHRGGAIIGASNKMALSAFLQPFEADRGRSKPFHGLGKGWDELLLVPFQDMPGRISGFVVIGRDGVLDNGDWIYLQINPYQSRWKSGRIDAGLGMMPMLFTQNHSLVGNSGFVVTDPDIAVRMQLRHLRDHQIMLPLSAAWDDGDITTRRLDWLPHGNLIFWGHADPILPIVLAKQCGGQVAMESRDSGKRLSPLAWLRRLEETAVPWAVALEMRIKSMQTTEIDQVIMRAGLCGAELQKFISGCRPAVQERIRNITDRRIQTRRVEFEGRWVYETHDGWYLEHTNQRISNAVVRITKVLTAKHGKDSYYQGYVRFAGKEYTFTEKSSLLDHNLFCWVREFLRDTAKAGMPEFAPSWNRRGLQLAIALHQPDMATGVHSVGWDEDNQQINFPQFTLQRDGTHTTEYKCLFQEKDAPGAALLPPEPLSTTAVTTLSLRTCETRFFWAMAAYVASTILSPIMRRPVRGMLLAGCGAQQMGMDAARVLGVPVRIGKLSDDPLAVLQQLLGPHKYPVAMTNFPPGPWLDTEDAGYLVYAANPVTCSILSLRLAWHRISCNDPLGSLQLIRSAAANVLPRYIQDVYSRGVFIADSHDDLLMNVLDDMAAWFTRESGDPESVLQAAAVLSPAQATPGWQLVMQLLLDIEPHVVSCDADAFGGEAPGVIVNTPKNVWVSQMGLCDAALSVGGIVPDVLLITRAIESIGGYEATSAFARRIGWVFDRAYLEKQRHVGLPANS